jgi:hypothetical protein
LDLNEPNENARFTVTTKDVDWELLRALDRAIDDLEAGREYSVEEGMKKAVREEWQARAEEFGGGGEDAFLAYMKYLLAAPCKILIEQFGWSPPPKNAEGKRYRIVRFANAVIDEIEAVSADETQDIRRYAEQVRDKYGIEFLKEAEDE